MMNQSDLDHLKDIINAALKLSAPEQFEEHEEMQKMAEAERLHEWLAQSFYKYPSTLHDHIVNSMAEAADNEKYEQLRGMAIIASHVHSYFNE